MNKGEQSDAFRWVLGAVLVVAAAVMYVAEPERRMMAVFVLLAGLAMVGRSGFARHRRRSRGDVDLLDGP